MTTSAKKTELNYGAEIWRKPSIEHGEVIVFSEYGRVLNNIDYRSHWFLLVQELYGGHALIVKHGGGQERWSDFMLGKSIHALTTLSSDDRYLMLYTLYDAHKLGFKQGQGKASQEYKEAFVEGRLKKRKQQSGGIKVWINN